MYIRKPSLLIVEDRELSSFVSLYSSPQEEYTSNCEVKSFEIDTAICAEEARSKLSVKYYDAVLLDLSIPERKGEKDHIDVGLELLKKIPNFPYTAVVVITLHASQKIAVTSFKTGGIDFIDKREAPSNFIKYQTVAKACERAKLIRDQKWLEALESQEMIRTATSLRQQSDDFTATASEFYTKINNSIKLIKKLIQSRLGIELEKGTGDELGGELLNVDTMIVESSKKFRLLRDKFQIEFRAEKVNIKNELSCLLDKVQILAADKHIKIEHDFTKVDAAYQVFLCDFQGTIFTMLMCALENANIDSNMQFVGKFDANKKELEISVGFQSHKEINTLKIPKGNKVISFEESVSIVKILAKSMGGDITLEEQKDNNVFLTLVIPIVL